MQELVEQVNDIGRVMIATPIFDKKLATEYCLSLLPTLALTQQYGIQVDVATVGGDCFMDKVRNTLVAIFLESPCNTLFFIDGDQGWDPPSFIRMLLHLPPIVGGAVHKKSDEEQQRYSHVMLDVDDQLQCFVQNGLVRVRAVGTGFLRIRRSAIEQLLEAGCRWVDPGDGGPQKRIPWLFETGIIDDPVKDGEPPLGRFYGEDIFFCRKWIDQGGELWIDPQIDFKHVGTKAWSGNFLHHLQKHAQVITHEQPTS